MIRRYLMLFVPAVLSCTGVAGDSQRAPRLLNEDLRIGSVDGPDALTTPGVVAVGPDGDLYVVQSSDQQIRVYGQDGELLRSLGGRGGGPGEFERIATFGFLGDTFYVSDARLRRMTFMSLSGSVLEMVNVAGSMEVPFFPSVPQTLFADGTGTMSPSFPSDMVSSGAITRFPLYRVTRNGEVLDTVAWQSTENMQFAVAYGTGQLFSSQPFADNPFVVADGPSGRVAVIERRAAAEAMNATFRVTFVSLQGDTLDTHAYPYEPVPMPDSLVEATVEARSRVLERVIPARGEAEAAARKALYLPRFFVPVTGAMFDSEGRLWLLREDDPGRPRIVDVIDSSGRLVDRMALPIGAQIKWAGRDVLWTLERDELDVPYLVRYRIAG
jgi:hypothetical protein